MSRLEDFGWRPVFAAQLGDDDRDRLPARVSAVHRDRLALVGPGVPATVAAPRKPPATGIAVGDWVLLDPDALRVERILERFGVFRRRAAGAAADIQWLAANVDTVFIVTSANRDFNTARLERYLALARDAGAWPVIVLTKTDLVESATTYERSAEQLAPGLAVEGVDARDPGAVQRLAAWCGSGQTVALLGSSGVGKSTLTNTLAAASQFTAGVREDDQRGRHTTTARSMHHLAGGGWLIDTPGMRELQLADMADAIEDVFDDVRRFARNCRFGDCRHDGEPGCAVQAAIDAGDIDPGRLLRFRKLQAEDRRNTASVAERRQRDRAQGRYYKVVMDESRRRKHGDD